MKKIHIFVIALQLQNYKLQIAHMAIQYAYLYFVSVKRQLQKLALKITTVFFIRSP